jgi:bifunctional non-homologous end joining protein LigD
VSAPVTWQEVERGFEIEDFRMDNVRERLAEFGDLWAPIAAHDSRDRFDLRKVVS